MKTIVEKRPAHPSMARRLALLAGAATLASALPAIAAETGRPAPVVQLPGRDGAISLDTLRGKVVLLDFWASWCGPCRQSFPWMNEMQQRYGARGLQVLAINLDRQRADAEAFLRQVPARFAVAFDAAGETPRRYAVKAMPTSVLIGREGTVLLQHGGFREVDKQGLEAAIADALAR